MAVDAIFCRFSLPNFRFIKAQTCLFEHLLLVVVKVLSELSNDDLQTAVGSTGGAYEIRQSHYAGFIDLARAFCVAAVVWVHVRSALYAH